MKKTKYYYNTRSLRYEEIKENWFTKSVRLIGFICAVALAAVFLLFLSFAFFDSPKEKALEREVDNLYFQYGQLNNRVDDLKDVLVELEDKDDNIYRVIFEAEPIPKTVRQAGSGGSKSYKELEGYSNTQLLKETTSKIDQLQRKIAIQSMSYDEIAELIANKSEMLASIPHIQPVSNKTLKRLASGYGYRIHPIHKIRKFHRGVDFTAPKGTPVFSTGDGVIKKITKSSRGYGNRVLIDHGFFYETLYAHLNSIDVKKGQTVKKGEQIGTVGSTGLSTAPHLHYEVHYQGKTVDPKYFFHGDLNDEEFDKLIEIANQNNQSFD